MHHMVCETFAPFIVGLDNPQIQEFTLFNKLSLDLRLMVWGLCMPPRIVEIHFDRRAGFCLPANPIPVLLHLNQETRAFALKHYELAFGNEDYEATIYFNFKVDTLYIGAGNVEYGDREERLRAFGIENTRNVKHLAIDSELKLHRSLIYLPRPHHNSNSDGENVS